MIEWANKEEFESEMEWNLRPLREPAPAAAASQEEFTNRHAQGQTQRDEIWRRNGHFVKKVLLYLVFVVLLSEEDSRPVLHINLQRGKRKRAFWKILT